MDVFYYDGPVPHAIIENYYSEEELKEVWLELDFLTHEYKLKPPDKTGTAKNKGIGLKHNHGIFIDSLYSDRDVSNILRLFRKHFDTELTLELMEHHFIFNYLFQSKKDTTLLSYYENEDNYLPHSDQAAMTVVTWLFKEPCQFQGGDFFFSDYNYKIPIQNNCTIIFPSVISHAVSPVKMTNSHKPFSGFGRYALTNFVQMI